MEIDTDGYVLQFKKRRRSLLGSEGQFIIFFFLPIDFPFPINGLLYSGDYHSIRRNEFIRERELNLFPGKNTDCYLRLCHKAALMRSAISCSFSLGMDTS